MRDLTKAQLTIGLLAFFATMWSLVKNAMTSSDDIIVSVAIIIVLLVVQIILSIVILGLLQWVNIYDLKTNSLITFIILVVVGLTATL
jgi:hypothetical protein